MRPPERWGDYKAWANMGLALPADLNDFCAACGYAKSTWHHWKKTGRVPKTALLAAEALTRRKGANVHGRSAFVKIEVINDTPVISPLKIQEVTILGRTYRVIEE